MVIYHSFLHVYQKGKLPIQAWGWDPNTWRGARTDQGTVHDDNPQLDMIG